MRIHIADRDVENHRVEQPRDVARRPVLAHKCEHFRQRRPLDPRLVVLVFGGRRSPQGLAEILLVKPAQLILLAHSVEAGHQETRSRARQARGGVGDGQPAATGKGHAQAIEQVFSKLKHLLRKASERTAEATWKRIGDLLDTFKPEEVSNYFKNSGYAST